jgi:rhodanese-related sulfurtransferase
MTEAREQNRESMIRKDLPEPTRVTVEEVKARIDRGEPITFLDCRSAEDWEKADVKIKGAIRVPPKEVHQYLDQIPRDRSVVTYCT